ncbi:hypothetical protein G6F57_016284 [Rhizopus arrhizus]|nr:hypothetical protein G6F57_016284 [Rhizopus arrhizus]
MADAGACALHRRGDIARQRDVVVLDQDRVIQAEAVVAAAPHAHRILLHGAQARHGLARAGDAGAVSRNGAGNGGGGRGHAAQVAQEIQRHAFRGQHRAGIAAYAGDFHTRPQVAAVGLRYGKCDSGIHRAKRQAGQVQAGQHAFLARDQARFRHGVCRHDGIGGAVAGAAGSTVGAAAPAAPLAATAANSKWKMGQPQASARRLAETRRPGNRIRGRRVPARKRWSRPWRVCAARSIRDPLVASSPAGVSPSSLSPS